MVRILIADDHVIVREGLKQMIADTTEFAVTGEATNGQEVIDLLAKEAFDILVLDLSMPGRGGLETLKQVRLSHPDLPVLILSMYPEEQFGVRVMKAGACGYLNKQSAASELINAIRRIASGRKYITETIAEKLAQNLESPPEEERYRTLSDREFLVLRQIGSGLSVSEIATQLNLSVKTISTYRQRILVKMQMKNNSELTHYVVENHLLD
jgi:two-component system, NarL family, invasion response regulator UvrY